MTLPNARDIALIFLVLQALIGCAIPLAILIAVTHGLVLLNRKTRSTMPTVQGYARQVAAQTDRLSQRVASPLISVHSRVARWQAMQQGLARPGQIIAKNRPTGSKTIPTATDDL